MDGLAVFFSLFLTKLSGNLENVWLPAALNMLKLVERGERAIFMEENEFSFV